MEQQTEKLEEQIAHLTRLTDELSDIVAGQADEISTLTRRVAMLMRREAEREVAEGVSAPVADQPPPHW